MWNEMTLLASHLSQDFDVKIKINRPEICNIYEADFFDSKKQILNTECIYIVSANELNDCQILQMEGNFLLIQDSYNAFSETDANISANYIVLSNAQNTTQIYKALRSCCQAFSLLRKNAYSFLNILTASNNNIAQLINKLSFIVENPVALFDKNMNLIYASSMNKTGDKIWDSSINGSEELIKNLSLNSLSKKMIQEFGNELYYPTIFTYESWMDRLIAPVWVDGKCQYLLETVASNTKIGDYEKPFFAAVCDLFQEFLKKDYPDALSPKRIAAFLEAVLSDKYAKQSIIIQEADTLGLKLNKNNILLMILDKGKTYQYYEMYALFCEIKCNLVFKEVFIYEHNIMVLLSNDNADGIIHEIELYKKFLKSKGVYISASSMFYSIYEIPVAYRQCQACAKFGPLMNSGEFFFNYEDYMEFHLLAMSSEFFNIKDFLLPQIHEIIEYDQKNGTEYAITLRQYIRCFKNINAVSQNLHVHRNTVVYRIERMAEIFNLDYDNLFMMWNLGLSFDIWSYANKCFYA